ncbi:hypothetical protein ACMYSQ_009360 [Aspergillus niger]|jgi:hypothetical protein
MKASSCNVEDREATDRPLFNQTDSLQAAQGDKTGRTHRQLVELLQMRRTKIPQLLRFNSQGAKAKNHNIGKGMSRHTGHHRIMEPGRALVMMVLEAGIGRYSRHTHRNRQCS